MAEREMAESDTPLSGDMRIDRVERPPADLLESAASVLRLELQAVSASRAELLMAESDTLLGDDVERVERAPAEPLEAAAASQLEKVAHAENSPSCRLPWRIVLARSVATVSQRRRRFVCPELMARAVE